MYTNLLRGRRRLRGLGIILDSGAAAAGDAVDEAEEPVLELGGEAGHGIELVRFFWRCANWQLLL
jgi:hypothetical protein